MNEGKNEGKNGNLGGGMGSGLNDGSQRHAAAKKQAQAAAHDSIPMLTEVVELPSAVFDSVPGAGDSGPAPLPAVLPQEDLGEEDLRAVRQELMSRVMMRFRTEWPQVVLAHTEATIQSRLAPLTAQLATELTQALEARLVEWLDATLEEIERTPGGN